METDRIGELLSGLRSTPSRRAVSFALMPIVASTTLAPLFGQEGAEAKHKKKKKKKKNDPQDLIPQTCAFGEIACNNDPFACCAANLCTEKCSCCPATKPACCGTDANAGNHFCYDPLNERCCTTTVTGIAGACPKGWVCSTGAGGLIPTCCPSGAVLCGAGCCPPGTFCCASGTLCCVDISCDTSIGACGAPPPGLLARTQ